MLASLLCLQKDTAWNNNSVLELDLDGIVIRDDTIEIQGYKSRVGKETPLVILDSEHATSIRAISFLIARLDLMKKWGLVAPSEKRLWLNATSMRTTAERRPVPYVGWGSALKPFQAKWKLPKFSFEQVRVQASVLIGIAGGIEAMRRQQHHGSINSTARYFDQPLTRRINAASNLEFQRRVEQQFIKVVDIHRRPDGSSMLLPIGDGTSCIDPGRPPFDDYLDGDMCAGTHCHSNQGCPNNRFIVDRERIEEAARTERYYQANWARLLDENESAFAEYHLPSMAFNKCLLEVLVRGPFGHVVRAIRADLTEEEKHG
jgi:hypothetical protein